MDNNYPPYAFLDDKGNMQGITIDQWRLWEQHTGVKVDVTGLPWDQALTEMKAGKFDVIDTIFYTDERAKIYDFTPPYANIDVMIFFPSNVSGIADVESLKGFRVAVKSGDANAEYLLQHGVTDLVYYESYEDIIKAAKNKQVTLFVIDRPPAAYFLFKYGIQDEFNYSGPLYGGQFHHAVKKGDKDLFNLINEGFADIKSSEYEAVDARWFGTRQTSDLSWLLPYVGIAAAIVILIIAALGMFNRVLGIRVRIRTNELEQALEQLRVSEAQFRASVEFLPIPIGLADPQGNILLVNQQFTEHYGYELRDIPTISIWMEHAYPNYQYRQEVNTQWDEDVRKAVEKNTATPLREYQVTGKAGKVHDVEIVMYPTGDLWVTSFIEITERKRAARKIHESEIRYRTLFEDSPVPLLEEDFSEIKTYFDDLKKKGVDDFRAYFKTHIEEAKRCLSMAHVVDVNKAMLIWTGVGSKAKFLNNLSGLMLEEEYQTFINEVLALMEGGDHYQLAVSRNTREGKFMHHIVSGTIVPGHEKSWKRILISILDITDRKLAEDNLARAYDTTLEGWSHALDLRDKETEGHTRRVTEAAVTLARALNISEEEIIHIKRGGLLHDIGKMGIPDSILLKPAALTDEEWTIMHKHPTYAYEMLSQIDYLKPAMEIPYCHHEKWDGSGYPRGLRGEQIPLSARIFAVVDVWDALSFDRPYRNGWTKEQVIEKIRSEAGTHFDPKVVTMFLDLLVQGKIS